MDTPLPAAPPNTIPPSAAPPNTIPPTIPPSTLPTVPPVTPSAYPRLELVWANKDKYLLSPYGDEGEPVWVDRDHPHASETRLTNFAGSVGEVDDSTPYADNLIFTGDSIDVLRILTQSPEYAEQYRGKVKLVYIDPPFNTGHTFEHYDDGDGTFHLVIVHERPPRTHSRPSLTRWVRVGAYG